MMDFKLTKKVQLSKLDTDNKYRNYILYFVNGVLILRQKIPFDTNFEKGFDRRTGIYNEYITNGKLFQTRCRNKKIRNVRFPLSPRILRELNIPLSLKITIDGN